MINMKKLIFALLITFGLAVTPVSSPNVLAIDLFPDKTCQNADCSVVKAGGNDLSDRVQNIINIALLVMGGVAVIMIIVGALRMILANGDPGNIKSGRLTIMWSLVGVAVIIMSSVIVNFVVNWSWLN